MGEQDASPVTHSTPQKGAELASGFCSAEIVGDHDEGLSSAMWRRKMMRVGVGES